MKKMKVWKLVFPNYALFEHFQHAMTLYPPGVSSGIVYSEPDLVALVPIAGPVNWSDVSGFWGGILSETPARVVGRNEAAERRQLAKVRATADAARADDARRGRLEQTLDRVAAGHPRAAQVAGRRGMSRVGPPVRAQVSGRRERDHVVYRVSTVVPGAHYRISWTTNGRPGGDRDVRGDARATRDVLRDLRRDAPGEVVWPSVGRRRS